jgi:hypothetical protein
MCCGNKRAALAAPTHLHPAAPGVRAAPSSSAAPHVRAATSPPAASVAGPLVVFQCVAGALTVTGAVSGRRYHFMRHGERQAVDARDRPSLLQVPGLRWVR